MEWNAKNVSDRTLHLRQSAIACFGILCGFALIISAVLPADGRSVGRTIFVALFGACALTLSAMRAARHWDQAKTADTLPPSTTIEASAAMKRDWRLRLMGGVLAISIILAIADAGGRRTDWLVLTFCGLLVLGLLLRKPDTSS